MSKNKHTYDRTKVKHKNKHTTNEHIPPEKDIDNISIHISQQTVMFLTTFLQCFLMLLTLLLCSYVVFGQRDVVE